MICNNVMRGLSGKGVLENHSIACQQGFIAGAEAARSIGSRLRLLNRMRPEVGSRMRKMQRPSVVFPEPLSPTMPRVSPRIRLKPTDPGLAPPDHPIRRRTATERNACRDSRHRGWCPSRRGRRIEDPMRTALENQHGVQEALVACCGQRRCRPRPMLHHVPIHDGDLIGDLCDDTHVMRMNISAAIERLQCFIRSRISA